MPQAAAVQAFISGEKSYIAGLLPSKALNIPGSEILDWLDARLGQDTVDNALDPELHFPSPVAHWTSGGGVRAANNGGINGRSFGSF